MSLALQSYTFAFATAAVQSNLDDIIIRFVNLHDGIKDTQLTVLVLAETADPSTNPNDATQAVVQSIHNLIQNGRLVGVDCETPTGGFTMVLPLRSRPTIAMPIFITYSGTRH